MFSPQSFKSYKMDRKVFTDEFLKKRLGSLLEQGKRVYFALPQDFKSKILLIIQKPVERNGKEVIQ